MALSIEHALSVQSDFSIGKSLLQTSAIAERAAALGYKSVALVDDMSVHAMVDFMNRCKKANVQPIAGCRLRVYEDATWRKPAKSSGIEDKPNPMTMPKVYVKTEAGMKSLLRLLSEANDAEHFYYNSRTDLKALLALQDVIVTTGDFYSLFSVPDYEAKADALLATFGTDFYVELVPVNSPLFDTINARALKFAESRNCQTIVTHPFCYASNEDAETLDVMSAIASNTQMDVSWRPKQAIKDFGFVEPGKLLDRVKAAAARNAKWDGVALPKLWAQGVHAIANIPKQCVWTFEKQDVSLPSMGANEFMLLGKKCIEGFKRRFSAPVLGHQPANLEPYKERMAYELSVLKKMGFAGYFLLVEDLVMWAKKNGVIVGPGRGSVGGSLVAYLLGITDVDPLRFNLMFERFINPDRLDLPDADLDFMSSKRHLVVQYLTEKYGKDRVAGISNYSTLASASALRDTGRIHGLQPLELNATKLVPKEHGQSVSLEEAADAVPELDMFRTNRPAVWKHATKLEGTMKSFGQHAAGIIVAGEPLVNRAVVETRGESPVVNWDKRVVEDWGLIKMDLLGLSTLDVLEIARQYILERHGRNINYLDLPLEDPKVMAAFGRGETTGVFQFESGGMRALLKNLAEGGALTFEDIAAATALYRPGPMDSGQLDDFVAIKQGKMAISYDHPNMEAALAPTYGVIVYQEQVMQVAVDLAGFTRAEADKLRKVMGKKDKDGMAAMRDKWIKGCEEKSSLSEARAGSLFDKIEAFAGYGFNKSHAVEYSIISVWCCWLRVNYPAEYFAASLSIVDSDKYAGLVSDAREAGIEVSPPDINGSTERFTIPDDKHILTPFSAVKGVSETTALAIVRLRESNRDWMVVKTKRSGEEVYGRNPEAPVKGRFDSMQEFVYAAGETGSKVSARVVEVLDKVGAFASVEPSQLRANHFERRKDQTELMPGLIIDVVKATRQTDVKEPHLRSKIIMLAQEYKACGDCDLSGQPHPTIRCKATVKYMVVADGPSWEEEKADKLLEGETAKIVKAVIAEQGLGVPEGYFTALVKAKKQDKFYTNAQLNGCRKFLEREIELVKPSVIVAMGSAAIKHFVPGHKGGTADLVGKAIYNSALDATIVCGLNPAQIIFNPEKLTDLQKTFAKVAEVLS